MSVDKIPDLIRKVYSVVVELERLFPQRKFTPDGILIGSIGEVLAAYHYGLRLLPQNSANHDACTPDGGTQVQVKTTQRTSKDGHRCAKGQEDCQNTGLTVRWRLYLGFTEQSERDSHRESDSA